MELDIKTLITVGGIAASVIGSAAVAKHQLKTIHENIKEIFASLKKLDQRTDKHDINAEMLTSKVSVLASMMSPDTLERRHREVEALKKDVEFLKDKIK
jgi:predicted RNase H-like nuclease (RuvC/YqgF family)